MTGSQTEVGSSDNTYDPIWSAEGNNYTAKEGNYTVTEELGTLTVTKPGEFVITITGNSGTKVYNTKEQSVNGYEVSEYDPEKITIKKQPAQDAAVATAKGTNVGTYTMTMTKDDFAATSDFYTSVTFNVVPGTLEITPV